MVEPSFSDEVCLIVPSKIGRVSIDSGMYVRGVTRMLVDLAGGATKIKGEGVYVTERGELVEEEVTMVVASVKTNEQLLNEVMQIAQWLKRDMQQESVMLKINSKTYLV